MALVLVGVDSASVVLEHVLLVANADDFIHHVEAAGRRTGAHSSRLNVESLRRSGLRVQSSDQSGTPILALG